LRLGELADGSNGIPEMSRELESLFRGGCVHFLIQALDQVGAFAFHEELQVLHPASVFLAAADGRHAWPQAALDVVIQTDARAGSVDVNRAGADLEVPTHQFEGTMSQAG